MAWAHFAKTGIRTRAGSADGSSHDAALDHIDVQMPINTSLITIDRNDPTYPPVDRGAPVISEVVTSQFNTARQSGEGPLLPGETSSLGQAVTPGSAVLHTGSPLTSVLTPPTCVAPNDTTTSTHSKGPLLSGKTSSQQQSVTPASVVLYAGGPSTPTTTPPMCVAPDDTTTATHSYQFPFGQPANFNNADHAVNGGRSDVFTNNFGDGDGDGYSDFFNPRHPNGFVLPPIDGTSTSPPRLKRIGDQVAAASFRDFIFGDGMDDFDFPPIHNLFDIGVTPTPSSRHLASDNQLSPNGFGATQAPSSPPHLESESLFSQNGLGEEQAPGSSHLTPGSQLARDGLGAAQAPSSPPHLQSESQFAQDGLGAPQAPSSLDAAPDAQSAQGGPSPSGRPPSVCPDPESTAETTLAPLPAAGQDGSNVDASGSPEPMHPKQPTNKSGTSRRAGTSKPSKPRKGAATVVKCSAENAVPVSNPDSATGRPSRAPKRPAPADAGCTWHPKQAAKKRKVQ